MLKIRPSSVFITKQDFLKYVNIHNSAYRPHSDSKSNYLNLIKMHNTSNDYARLLKQSNYVQLAYNTLQDWNMDQRGAKLASFNVYSNSILSNENILTKLHSLRLELLNTSALNAALVDLKTLFVNLKVMQTKARIVGVSKTLHFLLPNLVMPIDRNNILDLLYLGAPYSANPQMEFRIFGEIMTEYNLLCRSLSLSISDVNNIGWNTSIPKMIDNALIAFLAELLKGNITIIPKQSAP